MREYETVFITQPNLTDSQQKQFVERLKSLVEKHQGRVFFARDMGKKSLAYPIGKQRKGIYTCLDYAAGGAVVSDLERSLRLDENVLRFLTVVKVEDVDVEARAAEVIARGEDVASPQGEAVKDAPLKEKGDPALRDVIADGDSQGSAEEE